MHEQTIWLAPRATAFTEACETCKQQHPERPGGLPATVSGHLPLEHAAGWATCRRGHTVRVFRTRGAVPAGAPR